VTFHATAPDAERAGFRPCKRCRPNEPPAAVRAGEQVAAMCRLLETHPSTPSLEAIAQHVGLSTSHAHRMFKAATGLTPRAYALALRRGRLRTALAASPTVTHAMYESGYSSSGRFYEESDALLGMTPSELRAGGAKLAIRFAVGVCSLGSILVAATARGVCAVLLGDQPEPLITELERCFPRAELVGADAAFESVVREVVSLVDHMPPRAQGAPLPLDIRGTAFQQRVWQALTAIPVGTTVTYAELAATIGKPRAIRAVASACASNAIAVLIPCHRVVRQGGALAGYRWGIERKRALLENEAGARFLMGSCRL